MLTSVHTCVHMKQLHIQATHTPQTKQKTRNIDLATMVCNETLVSSGIY